MVFPVAHTPSTCSEKAACALTDPGYEGVEQLGTGLHTYIPGLETEAGESHEFQASGLQPAETAEQRGPGALQWPSGRPCVPSSSSPHHGLKRRVPCPQRWEESCQSQA